ncbi:MAG: tRNA-dihydrouridine synthase B [Rubritalea sp.]|jgi:tRNA-dihydrouridine synthase B|tara:strand:- start:1692 stop:2696 length:1005 start_codon:yes stop_codon:yes gene_type:complete
MLPWFENGKFPLYLAPMAGVTDVVFRTICKELGADVVVTEFVSAEGIMQRDAYTKKYTEFHEEQRPLGIQIFGADGARMGEAAKKIIDWKQPDFIDINFGCPVNKVVSKNGGSSLLRDCPLLASVASGVAKAVGDQVPVTAKIRVGWDQETINAPEVCKTLEESGMQAISIHGRTRSQGYRGEADWDVIQQCTQVTDLPIVGNGDIATGADVKHRRETTDVNGVMIGRAAMQNPWVFREAKHYLKTGEQLPPIPMEERWELIVRHCSLAIQSTRYGGEEKHTIMAMRARLMAYCKGFPGAKPLRSRLCQVSSLSEVEDLAAEHLSGKLTPIEVS